MLVLAQEKKKKRERERESIHEPEVTRQVPHTVNGYGNALEKFHAILTAEGWDLAELADLKVLGDPGLFNNPEFQILRLCDGLGRDGSWLVALR